MTNKTILTHNAELTPKSDKRGVEIYLCNPQWFDVREKFKITNAPKRTAELEFDGADLNFVARVLYAESSGSAQLLDNDQRLKEKEAILNVKHFRLNRMGYPNRVKTKTFTEVCRAPNQFESVFGTSKKFLGSDNQSFETLKQAECLDLSEAILAVRKFIEHGPNDNYLFDNFRGGAGKHGLTIGLTRFWLSEGGKMLYENEK